MSEVLVGDTTPASEHRLPSVAREVGLTVAAAIGVVSLVCLAASMVFGITPLIVAGGSMGPDLPLGSLALAASTPAEQVRHGDVVSVVRNDGSRVTHRVVTASGVGGGLTELTLQGDANPGPDAERHVVDRVDRVRFSMPTLGSILTWWTSSTASFLLGLLSACLLWWAFAPGRTRRVGAVLRLPIEQTGSSASEPERETVPTRPARTDSSCRITIEGGVR